MTYLVTYGIYLNCSISGVESAWGFKDLRGGHWLSSRYQHEQRTSVHCCYTHREAADYVARNMGLELI